MIHSSGSHESGSVRRLGRLVFKEGRASLTVFWGVFWKVTAVTTVLFFLIYFGMHTDDLTGRLSQTAFAIVVVFGYCLFYAFWIGLGAGTCALAWRWCRAWIIVPAIGALLGAIAAIALTFVILRDIDLRGAGLHGGGEIAAVLVLGLFAISSIIGAIGGVVLSSVPILIVALIKRRRRQLSDDIDKPAG